MSQPANRFSVKKSGSPLKASKHQDKTNLISATDDGEVPGGGGVSAGVVLATGNGSATSFYGSVMKSKRKSGRFTFKVIKTTLILKHDKCQKGSIKVPIKVPIKLPIKTNSGTRCLTRCRWQAVGANVSGTSFYKSVM